MIKRTHILFVLCALCIMFNSCITAKKVNYMQEPDRHIPHYADTLSFEDYTLREGDRLYIYVYSLDPKITQMYTPAATLPTCANKQMAEE